MGADAEVMQERRLWEPPSQKLSGVFRQRLPGFGRRGRRAAHFRAGRLLLCTGPDGFGRVLGRGGRGAHGPSFRERSQTGFPRAAVRPCGFALKLFHGGDELGGRLAPPEIGQSVLDARGLQRPLNAQSHIAVGIAQGRQHAGPGSRADA